MRCTVHKNNRKPRTILVVIIGPQGCRPDRFKMSLSYFLLSFTLFACVQVDATTPIYFGFVATDNVTANELIPPVEIALEAINNSSSVLPGYDLTFVPWLSECDRTISLHRFLDRVLENCDGSQSGPVILGVVGCGCTTADLPVAELIHRWNIPQISYSSATASNLTNRDRFPNYLQLYSLENVGRGLQAILSAFSWRRLAVFTDQSARFTEVGEMIGSFLNTSADNVTQEQVILNMNNVTALSASLDKLKDDYRVFFLNTYSDTAREILCSAYEKNLVFPRYAWIIYGWYSSDWWVTTETSRCSNENIETFLEDSRVIAVQPYPMPENNDDLIVGGISFTASFELVNDLIVGGITGAEYYSRYKTAQEESGARFVPEFSVVYDSVWTLALALNTTLSNQNPASNSCASDIPLENFSYSSVGLGRRVRDAINQTNFNGASGGVMFDENGIRLQSYVTVLQYREGVTVEFGRVDVSVDSDTYNLTYATNENESTVYPGDTPPDGTPVKVVITFHVALIAVCYTLAVIGLIFTFICFLFNIIFRKRRIVRLTSPSLNYFILLGVVLVYCTIFVYLIPTRDSNIYRIRCYIQTWTITLGFSLGFGTVIAKLYRIVHIFKNPSPGKTSMQDWKLMIIALCIVAMAIVLLLVRLIIPPFRITPSLQPNSEKPRGITELGVTEFYCAWRCIGDNPVAYYYQIFYYIYILIILAVALILAIQTRKVKIEVLNDSKMVAAIIYFGVPTVFVFFLGTFVFASYVHVSAAIYCVGLFMVGTIFTAFVFVPKMVAFAKDPKGENVFKKSTNFSMHSSNQAERVERHDTMITVDTKRSKRRVDTTNVETEIEIVEFEKEK